MVDNASYLSVFEYKLKYRIVPYCVGIVADPNPITILNPIPKS